MRLLTVWLSVIGMLLAASSCSSDDPSIEEVDGKYRYPPWFDPDGGGPPPDWKAPEPDVRGSTPDTRSLSDVTPGDTAPQPDKVTVPPDIQGADLPCIPGTDCFADQYKIMGSLLVLVVDEQAYNPDWYLLDVLPPQGKTVKIRFRSKGFNQLNLVDVFLAPGANPFITFQWETPGMPGDLPKTLMPDEEVVGKIVYQPQGDPPANTAALMVWSSDPDHPQRVVVFKAKESGPDIELPVSAVNFGCGSYCFGQQFSIENGGNKDLVIQSTSFKTPSAEWSTADAPAPGTVLSPKGSPGYAPILFQLDYCDGDNNLNDSNEFHIYSNDPDENPAAVHLNVMLPNQCPNR